MCSFNHHQKKLKFNRIASWLTMHTWHLTKYRVVLLVQLALRLIATQHDNWKWTTCICQQQPSFILSIIVLASDSTTRHRDPEIRAWSVTADAWWSALAECSSASAGCHSLSKSPASGSSISRRLLCASFRSTQSSPSAICQTSSTVCSTCSAQHLRDSLPDDLRDPTVNSEFRWNLKTYLFAWHLKR